MVARIGRGKIAPQRFVRRTQRPRVGDEGRLLALERGELGNVETPDQEADAAIDLAQALLAVDVVGVLGPVAVARGPSDRRDEFGALLLHEVLELVLHARKTAGRHVVAGTRGQWRDEFLL